MGLNITIQQGRLIAAPIITKGQNENGEYIYAKFRIAVQRDYKEKDGTKKSDFKNCEAAGQTARFVQSYYHKGDLVVVEGPWYTKEYEKDGEKHLYEYINVRRTYPSYIRKTDKSIEENIEDTRISDEKDSDFSDVGQVPFDDELPPIPDEFNYPFQ